MSTHIAKFPRVGQFAKTLGAKTEMIIDKEDFVMLLKVWLQGSAPSKGDPSPEPEPEPAAKKPVSPRAHYAQRKKPASKEDPNPVKKPASKEDPNPVKKPASKGDANPVRKPASKGDANVMEIVLENFDNIDEAETGFVPRKILLQTLQRVVKTHPVVAQFVARIAKMDDLIMERADLEELLQSL